MELHYIKGNALEPIGENNKIIVHCCNDIGAWGAGFVMAISNKWKKPEKFYREMDERILGDVQFVSVETNIDIANIIGQEGIRPNELGVSPIRYSAIATALKEVNKYAKSINATIHMPRMGCGLAGGQWSIMEAVIKASVDVDVYVYDFVEQDNVNYVTPDLS